MATCKGDIKWKSNRVICLQDAKAKTRGWAALNFREWQVAGGVGGTHARGHMGEGWA